MRGRKGVHGEAGSRLMHCGTPEEATERLCSGQVLGRARFSRAIRAMKNIRALALKAHFERFGDFPELLKSFFSRIVIDFE